MDFTVAESVLAVESAFESLRKLMNIFLYVQAIEGLF